MTDSLSLKVLLDAAEATVLCEGSGKLDTSVRAIVACDLMSDVLVEDKDDLVIVTSLASDQSVRTAHVIGASAVLVVNGKQLPNNMVALAQRLDVTLARSALSKFRTCARIGRMMGVE